MASEDAALVASGSRDPERCRNFRAKLKSRALQISERFWTQSAQVFASKEAAPSYVPLLLRARRLDPPAGAESAKGPEKLMTREPTDRSVSPDDLLKSHHRKILLVGKPGAGKTAVACQILKLWAEGDDEDYVFYVDAGETPADRKPEDLLFGGEEAPADVRAGGATIVLDGAADRRLPAELAWLLPGAKLIVTCRPESGRRGFLADWDPLRVEVAGFGEESVGAYVSGLLSEEHASNVLRDPELLALCALPAHALMTAACFGADGYFPHPCTLTRLHLQFLHRCVLRASDRTPGTDGGPIPRLAEAAFRATREKVAHLPSPRQPDSFSKMLRFQAEERLCSFFLHTLQEFFAALWLAEDPESRRVFLRERTTERLSHMRPLLPLVSGLLNSRNRERFSEFFSSRQPEDASDRLLEDLVAAAAAVDGGDAERPGRELALSCRCVYESQSPAACARLLDALDHRLDLSEEPLGPQECCAASYVVRESRRKVRLRLRAAAVSRRGAGLLLRCLSNVQRDGALSHELWRASLLAEGLVDFGRLLAFDEHRIRLPVRGEGRLLRRAARAVRDGARRVKVGLYRGERGPADRSLCEVLPQCFPNIDSISVLPETLRDPAEETAIFGDLFCAAAASEAEAGEKISERLASACTYKTFPLRQKCLDFLLDLHSQDAAAFSSLLPALRPVLRSAPPVWAANLAERRSSVLLEVLRLQPEKKEVQLTGFPREESEARSFLRCLPFVSRLSVRPLGSAFQEGSRFFGNLFRAAAESEEETGETALERLTSACAYEAFPLRPTCVGAEDDDCRSAFLLDLFSHAKDSEGTSGPSVLPAVRSVLQSAPSFWAVKLSEGRSSVLLEVLKLQPEKKEVQLTGFSRDESEARSFLRCLPFISRLSIRTDLSDLPEGAGFFGRLFRAAAERDAGTSERLASVCAYKGFPLRGTSGGGDDDEDYRSDFLLDLLPRVKDAERESGLSVLPALRSVLRAAPSVWCVNLSERRSSVLLEALRLQPEKKEVQLTGFPRQRSEARRFLRCLPFIAQLSAHPNVLDLEEETRFFGNLFCAAATRGEELLERVAAACAYKKFPLRQIFWSEEEEDDDEYRSTFLLDVLSRAASFERKSGPSVVPALRAVWRAAAPASWTANLSERRSAVLPEALRLQAEKQKVQLTGFSRKKSEARRFLRCLPFISQLSCALDFFQSLCSSAAARSGEDVRRLASLLELLDFKLTLGGELNRKTCRNVGRVLRLCGGKVDVVLAPSRISVGRTADVFEHAGQLRRLSLSNHMMLLVFHWIRRGRVTRALAVEELSLLARDSAPASEAEWLKVSSALASLLRYWSVRRLDLTRSGIPALCLVSPLLHRGSLAIRLKTETQQELLAVLHQVGDEALTSSFLAKVDGDLTSCRLDLELLRRLLRQSPGTTVTVDLSRSGSLEETPDHLFPFLDRIRLKRPSPSFVMASINALYRDRASSTVPSLLRALDGEIDLSGRELDSDDSSALFFALDHAGGARLNLRQSRVPAETRRSLVVMLDRVSRLSVDGAQLLELVRCCAASDAGQKAAWDLLRALEHQLDFSCPKEEPLRVTADDCGAVSSVLRHSGQRTLLDLRGCELRRDGLDLLFAVLDGVRLRVSQDAVLQLLSLVPATDERDTRRRARSLRDALGRQLDLSRAPLDERACADLVRVLDLTEGPADLDLRHCGLTDRLLLLLSAQMRKVEVLDLRHNEITDGSTPLLLQVLADNPSIKAVRIFSNKISDQAAFQREERLDIW